MRDLGSFEVVVEGGGIPDPAGGVFSSCIAIWGRRIELELDVKTPLGITFEVVEI